MIVMRLIFILFTLWCLPGLAQQIAVPELRQQVTDITGTLSTSEQQSLTQQLQDITHKTRAQVAVLVVPSTGDDSIEQYATGFAPIFPDTCYHLTHYWPAAADIPV
ncbi:TPM domain-containing protein, partial [Escherichia coli]|uniref:TPM domain-containing protein n=1 Tax=Escherichia coli TaxID=562 RepID=UPI001F4937BC